MLYQNLWCTVGECGRLLTSLQEITSRTDRAGGCTLGSAALASSAHARTSPRCAVMIVLRLRTHAVCTAGQGDVCVDAHARRREEVSTTTFDLIEYIIDVMLQTWCSVNRSSSLTREYLYRLTSERPLSACSRFICKVQPSLALITTQLCTSRAWPYFSDYQRETQITTHSQQNRKLQRPENVHFRCTPSLRPIFTLSDRRVRGRISSEMGLRTSDPFITDMAAHVVSE